MRAPTPSFRSLRLLLGLAVSAVALFLATRQLDPAAVWEVLRRAEPVWVLAALILVALNLLAKVARWRLMFGPAGSPAPTGRLLKAVLIGQGLNYLLPVRFGEISRTAVIGNTGPGYTFTLGTIALEKVLDLSAYALLCGALLLMIPIPGWVEVSTTVLGVTALAFSGLVFWLAHRRGPALRILRRVLAPAPQRLRTGLLDLAGQGLASLRSLQSWGAVARLALWTLIIWGTALLTNHLALWALGLSLPLTASLLLLVALIAGITLPAGPGRIGVFEYLSVLALRPYLVPQDVAFGFGLLLHAIVMLPILAGGLAAFWLGRTARDTRFEDA